MKYATLLLGLAIVLASFVTARAGDFFCPNGVKITPAFADKTTYTIIHEGEQRRLRVEIKPGKPYTITVNGRACTWSGEAE